MIIRTETRFQLPVSAFPCVHPSKVDGKTCTIEYVYAPDGRKLRAVHKTYTSLTKKTVKTSTTTDYTNGYIFTNGKPTMYCFDGGYFSFDSDSKPTITIPMVV